MSTSVSFYRKDEVVITNRISILGLYECENSIFCEGWVCDNNNYPALIFYGCFQFVELFLSQKYQQRLEFPDEYKSRDSKFLFMYLCREERTNYNVENKEMKIFFDPSYILPIMERMYNEYDYLFEFSNIKDEFNDKENLKLFIKQLKNAIKDDFLVHIKYAG